MDTSIILVTGQQDCTRERFDKYYAPAIRSGIKKGCSFILGAADGVDKMAADLLAQAQHMQVTIYDKGNAKIDKGLPNWGTRSNFMSYPERDQQMCRDATRIIVYLFDEAAPTGTFYVLLKFAEMNAEGAFTPESVIDLARACQRDAKYSSKSWVMDMNFHSTYAYLKCLFVEE